MALLDWLTYPFRRGPRRPLAERRPERGEMGQEPERPLGMEATDLRLVDEVSRRNDALERTNMMRTGGRMPLASASSLHIKAMPEDETYAQRFHEAFQKKRKSQ